MNEKYSERKAREELIDHLKSVGLQEIEDKKREYKEILGGLNFDNSYDSEHFDYLISCCYALNVLKDYLSYEGSLHSFERMDPQNDVAIYIVDLKTINIWLNDGVVFKFLSHFGPPHSIPHCLDDSDFGYKSDFISIFEQMIYDENGREKSSFSGKKTSTPHKESSQLSNEMDPQL